MSDYVYEQRGEYEPENHKKFMKEAKKWLPKKKEKIAKKLHKKEHGKI